MYGSHDIPVRFRDDRLTLSIEVEGDVKHYSRECLGEKVEKTIHSKDNRILINPVEPVNTPKDITSYLLIDFEKPVIIEPETSIKIYLKFPVEIGIFISGKKKIEIIDVLTLVNQKFTLYGTPRHGIICKYWSSNVYVSMPTTDPMYEGVIQLEIINTSTHWTEVTKAVFNAYAMKIYYNDDIVSMQAKMKIMAGENAETDFVNLPLKSSMRKSVELYTTRIAPVLGTKFVMENGL